ncbi:MAG: acyltransferase [Akkermansia sp.]|nr:acyltransferase [Akkermansia sp.]
MLFHWRWWGSCTLLVTWYGYFAVELFFFMSGFGIYYSLSKRSDTQEYYLRRFWRIIPTCIVSGIIFLWVWHEAVPGLYSFDKVYPWLAFLGLDVWYIRTIAIYYLVAPAVYRLMHRLHYPLLGITLCSAIGYILLSFVSMKQCHFDFLAETTVIWSIKRFPAFLVGMYIAHKAGSGGNLVALGIMAVIAAAVHTGLTYAVMFQGLSSHVRSDMEILMFPCWGFVLWGMACCLRYVPGMLKAGVEWMGKYSLEIFLAHSAIFALLPRERWMFPVACAISLVAAVLVNRLAKRVRACFGE